MPSIKSIAATPALLAAFSMTAMPVEAAEMPDLASRVEIQVAAPAWAPGNDTADKYRRYRYRRHRGVDAGDVLAGVLILGGIAAVASAAKNSRERDRYRDARYPDPRRGDYRYDDGRGIDRAVTICVGEVERNARVETVDAANRNARGWNVAGTLYDGAGFSCSIGEDGRIDAIDYGREDIGFDRVPDDGGFEYGAVEDSEDRQYGEDYYAAARARTDNAEPSYPGGPLPDDDEQPYADSDIEYGTGYRGIEN
ncbi:hypothetical protein [Qipengyuania qiaonensis]|uniref:Secreted protein n=1 Tax=Qipengyuania qiaonensis TaxID=2867240 RepID=A0ABS7J6X1_9SPHN|nr:hypothetical protein [Qipengyuania qiaonensis]MBX7482688.1 hypothetical protein [Qipengyuania qiaonensis]